MNPLQNKRILLAISGGVAAYKAATLCSRLVQLGALVDVVMTDAAQKFITPLTFQALTHRRIYLNLWDIPDNNNIPHIDLADSADLLIIAPATANTIGRLANGLADNLLTAIAMATPAPTLIAPAMESDMWNHPATQANIEKLSRWGATIVGPAEGRLASGARGQGRLVEPTEIVEVGEYLLAQSLDLVGQRVLVTAGGTRESLDPVRFIGNRSTGKMGHALAESARNRGAAVTLITTTKLAVPFGIKTIRVNSALEMEQAVLENSSTSDALIMAAAVADFRPAVVAEQKIKKSADGQGMTMELTRNPDILAHVAAQKAEGNGPRVTVGFAAETEQLHANAQSKLARKRLDFIVANDVSTADAGFGVDTNRVTMLFADGTAETLPLMAKSAVADEIINHVARFL